MIKFPRIKQVMLCNIEGCEHCDTDDSPHCGANELFAERKSRAAWCRALAKKLHRGDYYGEDAWMDMIINIRDELLAQAERDDGVVK